MNADKALSTHFKSVVPEPWPACKAIGAELPTKTGLPGRAVLALAAALLLGVGLWLGGGEGQPQATGKDAPNLLKNATADGKNILLPRPMNEDMP